MFTKPGFLKLSNLLLILAGAWVIISPFLLGYEQDLVAKNNDIYAGIAVITLSLLNLFLVPVRTSFLSWVIGFLGLWQLGAPFLLVYSNTMLAMISAVLSGLTILAVSVWQILAISEEKNYIVRKPSPTNFRTSYASGINLRRINKESDD